MTTIGSVALASALALAGASSYVWVFAAAMLLAGAVDAIVDAAQNVQGVIVEQWRDRSIMNSLHALWSVGAAAGGVIGAACAALSVGLGEQMIVAGAVWSVVVVSASVLAAVPQDVRARIRMQNRARAVLGTAPDRMPKRSATWRLLLPLVVLAACGTLVEDVANNWVVLFLAAESGAPEGVAGLGLTVMLGAQFVGRVLGDPMTDRLGRDRVAQQGSVLIAVGSLLVMLAPFYPLAFLGFALAGFGSATLVPAACAAAGRIPGLPEGSAITVISWLMRVGFLVTSPAIGLISDVLDLRVAMVVPLVAGGLAALLARSSSRRTAPSGVAS